MAMPAAKGPLWKYFVAGTKQNGSHNRAHCLGCIEKERPAGEIIELDNDGNASVSSEAWVIEGKYHPPSILEAQCKFSSYSMQHWCWWRT
jgi:hypothetical protein